MRKIIPVLIILPLISCASVGDRMDARYWKDLGFEHMEAGRYEMAEEAFKEAITIKPSYVDAQNGLGMVYLKTGQFGKAIESFRIAVDLKPVEEASLHNLAEAYAKAGRYEQSLDTLNRALEIRPDDPLTHFRLGVVYMMKGDRAAAMEEYKILRRTDPERASQLWELILR